MPHLEPFNKGVQKKLKLYGLERKIQKQIGLLLSNPHYPSPNVELLEPKQYGIYSFRIDIKFRALCIFRKDTRSVELLNITVHYR